MAALGSHSVIAIGSNAASNEALRYYLAVLNISSDEPPTANDSILLTDTATPVQFIRNLTSL
jgi:hypothetical protein